MTEIRINNVDGVDWIYGGSEDWKMYVCDNFDEKIVVYGNYEYTNVIEATWWIDAKEIIDDLDYNGTDINEIEDVANYYGFTREIVEKIIKEYNECRYSNDIDFIVKVANILYPKKKIEVGRLNGYMREWQYFAYASADFENDPTNLLEAYYFGKISEISISKDDDTYYDIITHDDLWDMEYSEKGLKESLRERYEIAKDEELKVLKADSTINVLKWEEV